MADEFLDINEIRRRAMRLVVERFGLDVVCEKIQVHRNQMRHWIGKNHTRNMSDDVARRVEKAFKLPKNWMDNAHLEQESVIEQRMNMSDAEALAVAMQRAVELGMKAALSEQTSHFEKIAALEKRIAFLETYCPGIASKSDEAQDSPSANSKHEENDSV